MTRGDRAKQFMPFDAMKGLQEALRDREERHLRTQKRDISEEAQERNSYVISQIIRPTKVEIECYYNFHDVTLTGTVTRVYISGKYLLLNDERIYFDDIYSIRIIDVPSGDVF